LKGLILPFCCLTAEALPPSHLHQSSSSNTHQSLQIPDAQTKQTQKQPRKQKENVLQQQEAATIHLYPQSRFFVSWLDYFKGLKKRVGFNVK